MFFRHTAGGDPEFPDRGVQILQRGVKSLILAANLLIFLDFLKILHENEIIMSQRGLQVNPLWICHWYCKF